MVNRRRRTRVGFKTTVDVQATGVFLRNLETRDLSLKGIFITGSHPLELDQNCLVTVRLHGDEENTPVMRMEGKVARITDKGTAIDFTSIDPESYLHLRNVILFNAEDPEKAEQEFGTPAFEDSV